MSIDYEKLKQKVLEAAGECVRQGRGYSQEGAVLESVASEFGGNMHTTLDFDLQQGILTCWHDLFREGTLSWGLDLDNPGSPFFHIPDRSVRHKQPRR
jgi:hypothetical protein